MFGLVKQTLFAGHRRLSRFRSVPEAHWQSIISDLDSAGYHILENFWTPKQCEDGRSEIDRLVEDTKIKVQVLDEGVDRRIFGADRLSPRLNLFSDPHLSRMMQHLHDESHLPGFTLAARLEAVKKSDLGSGGGWHRDSALRDQYKALIYLSDCSEEHGPFEYLIGSANYLRAMRSYQRGICNVGQYRFTNDAVQRMKDEIGLESKIFPAKAGTLLLINTHGIHRGQPIRVGRRYALTNYYFRKQISPRFVEMLN